MLRSVAWLSWSTAEKSLSPDQPPGRTGSGSEMVTLAMAYVLAKSGGSGGSGGSRTARQKIKPDGG